MPTAVVWLAGKPKRSNRVMAQEFNSLFLPDNQTNIATDYPLLHSDKSSTVRHYPSAHNHAFISSYQPCSGEIVYFSA